MTVSIDNHVSWDLRRILVGIMFELKTGGGGGGRGGGGSNCVATSLCFLKYLC